MAVEKLTYQLLPEFEMSLWLNQVISPEHMEKLGCRQLRWRSCIPWSADPNRQVFGATHLIPFECLLQGHLNHSSQTLLLPDDQREGPDTTDGSNYADHSVRLILRRFWLRAHLPASASFQWSVQMGNPIPQSLLGIWCDSIVVCIQFPSCHRVPMLRCHLNSHYACTRTLSNPSGRLPLPSCCSWASCHSPGTPLLPICFENLWYKADARMASVWWNLRRWPGCLHHSLVPPAPLWWSGCFRSGK